MIDHLHIDIETYSSVDIKNSGAYKYVDSIDFEILLVAFAFNDETEQIVDLAQGEELPPRFLKAMADPKVHKHAHNATFERICFNVFGIKTEAYEWYCSQVKAGYCGFPLPLAAVSAAMDLGEQGKLSTGKALIRYFCVPCKPSKVNGGRTRNFPHHDMEKWEEFKRYCIWDVVAERAVEKRLEQYEIPAFERHNYIVDQEINDRGIKIDASFASNAIAFDNIYSTELKEKMKELTGVGNPNSPAQLKAWLGEAMGKEIKSLAKDEIPVLIEQAEDDNVKEVLKLRQKLAKSSIKKYTKMLDCICYNQRAHGLFQFYGAMRTGRFAGRLIQLQNLPQNHLDDLQGARDLVAAGSYDDIAMVYDDISSTLSQLIRTAFIADEGKTFTVADFSAIEARVIAWLAQEEWRMEVFRGDGKIYEASASMMFSIPIEEVTKGSDYRAKGKIAELALGYQGALGALKQMGGEDMGLSDSEMNTIVRKWRKASPAIVAFWADVEKKAMKAILTGESQKLETCDITYHYDGKALQAELPSGRRLFYQSATTTINKWGKRSIKYMGVDDRKQWAWIDSYGGKMVENCIAEGTEVLTDTGWKEIQEVSTKDLLWDGFSWVNHDGLIDKGKQYAILVGGVYVTPDHRILTNKGWQHASQSKRFNRSKIPFYRSGKLRRFRWQEVIMVNAVRLWKGVCNASFGVYEKEAEILRMQEGVFDIRETQDAQHEQASSVRGMEVNESKVFKSEAQSLAQLWRSWDNRVRRMVRKLRSFLGRYGVYVQDRFNFGQKRGERKLQQGKLPMGVHEDPSQKPEEKRISKHTGRQNDRSRSFGNIWDQTFDAILSGESRSSRRRFTVEAGYPKQVYDIKNAGPNKCFLVRPKGDNSRKMIVHNCVQAVARDLLTETMTKLSAEKQEIVMHVHDEAACSVPLNEAEETLDRMCELMGEIPPWAEGLPLTADGYITPFYKKD